MCRILIATTDIMPFRGLEPIAKELKANGQEVIIAADGKSRKLWETAEYYVTFGGSEDTSNYLPDDRVSEDIFDPKPDLVLVGCSTPNFLERGVAQLANAAGIPVVAYSDNGGSVKRLGKVSLANVLVTDELDAKIVREETPHMSSTIIGDVVASEMLKSEKQPDKEFIEKVNAEANGRRPILIVGQGLDYAPDLVATAIASLLISEYPRQLCIIPKLIHPKKVNEPDARITMEVFGAFPESFILKEAAKLDTVKLAQVPGVITWSVFSNTLKYAMMSGNEAVSVVTPRCRAGMEKSLGLSRFPLVDTKMMQEITGPSDLQLIQMTLPSVVTLRRTYGSSLAFSPVTAVRAILEVAQK